ncbi:MAG: hypothetical protein VX952_08610 [Pseudomonadota bacterium]|jgi:hypothetical protein|nr:hypothetical protein [Pseudomonadota bacterium]|tara:strand:- start:795 stop:1376 length:582 start_codon:yes stop_codon:yes gene_type:complete
MQEASSLNYDTAFKVLTFIITILTWFVVYNGATHLATRNESKELLADLHKQLKDKLDDSVEHWIRIIKSNDEGKIERSLFLQHSLIHISHLRHIKELFTVYKLNPITDSDIDELKRLLTESPDKATRADASALAAFYNDKIALLSRKSYTLIRDSKEAYNMRFKPNNISIHSQLKRGFKYVLLAMVLALALTL